MKSSILFTIVAICAFHSMAETRQNTNKMLENYLNLSSFRHKVLSQNVANINTPGYKAQEVAMQSKDSEPGKGQGKRRIGLVNTSTKHIGGRNGQKEKFSSHQLKDPQEIKKNGNTVSLAQQTIKISQNQQDYNATLKAYKSLNNLVPTVLDR